jgi:hypothetical protein
LLLGRRIDPRLTADVPAVTAVRERRSGPAGASSPAAEQPQPWRQVEGPHQQVHLTLEVVFDTKNTNAGMWAAIVRRPSELVLIRKNRRHSIILTWPPGNPEASVILEERA